MDYITFPISLFLYHTGHIECAIQPCDAKGGELPDDDFIDSPDELVSC